MQTAAVANAGAPAPQERGLSSLKSEDFFRILVTEMQQQDPLAPSETSDMISQVSQIRTIELSDQLTGTLDALAQQQRTANVSGLVGKFVSAEVTAADGSKSTVQGVVMAVRFDPDGTTVLELDSGEAVRAQDVRHVTTVEAVAAGLGMETAPADAADEAAVAALAGNASDDKDGQTAKASIWKPWRWMGN